LLPFAVLSLLDVDLLVDLGKAAKGAGTIETSWNFK
jgi:hypothetical protein